MKFIKKIVIIVTVVVIVLETLIEAVPNDASHSLMDPINIGVVFYRFDDPYVVLLKQSLENIENKNEGKVKFSFYDSDNDKAIQNQNINTLLESGKVNALILSLVDLINDPKEIIDAIPESLDFIKKGCMSGTVLQDPDVMAETFYEIAIHLACKTHFDCEKKYNCDETGKIIKLPFKEYIG